MPLFLWYFQDPVIDVLLKRRSLYIMKWAEIHFGIQNTEYFFCLVLPILLFACFRHRGIARYNYTHEILRESQSVFKGEVVERDRRISLIFRNEPSEDEDWFVISQSPLVRSLISLCIS